jgi:hypothetical protein
MKTSIQPVFHKYVAFLCKCVKYSYCIVKQVINTRIVGKIQKAYLPLQIFSSTSL